MKLPLVYNPRSGSGGKQPEALLARLPEVVRERLELTPFGPPWDYTQLIEQAQRAGGPLLVWGGDGTLHHAGRALVAAGCPVALGAIPGGSGNGPSAVCARRWIPHGPSRRCCMGGSSAWICLAWMEHPS